MSQQQWQNAIQNAQNDLTVRINATFKFTVTFSKEYIDQVALMKLNNDQNYSFLVEDGFTTLKAIAIAMQSQAEKDLQMRRALYQNSTFEVQR